MKTKYIYTITPSSDGFNVYLSTEELYGIEPIKGKLIAWFPDMKSAEGFVVIEEAKHNMLQEIRGNKINKSDIEF